ncbi:hypothetical protein ACIQGO_06795 [Streptomyces shenzhenensis]|uniref:hypothetical protein n=1 Tax=Streptomyces shenzhenensis TaxID=943815 RepID=UPI00382396FC
MTSEQQGGDGASEDPAGLPSVPDDVWEKFLRDSEGAIHVSGAPREPSARERMTPQTPARAPARVPGPAVGELWQREEPRTGPAWQELDGRAKARRLGRVLGAVTVTALILVAVRPGATGGPSGDPGTTVEQSVDLPEELPSATSSPASPSEDGEAGLVGVADAEGEAGREDGAGPDLGTGRRT